MPGQPGGKYKKQEKARGGCCWGWAVGYFRYPLDWVGEQDWNDRFGAYLVEGNHLTAVVSAFRGQP